MAHHYVICNTSKKNYHPCSSPIYTNSCFLISRSIGWWSQSLQRKQRAPPCSQWHCCRCIRSCWWKHHLAPHATTFWYVCHNLCSCDTLHTYLVAFFTRHSTHIPVFILDASPPQHLLCLLQACLVNHNHLLLTLTRLLATWSRMIALINTYKIPTLFQIFRHANQ